MAHIMKSRATALAFSAALAGVVLVSFIGSGSAFAQNVIGGALGGSRPSQGVGPLVAPSLGGSSFGGESAGVAPSAAYGSPSDVISSIEVVGNQRVEPATVISYMTIAPGDKFDPAKIDASLKALFATGLFADVSLRRDGSLLVANVLENPIINRVAFEGNDHVSDSQIEKEVQLKARVIYTRAKVQSDVQRVVEVYRRAGRFAATVEPKVIQLAQNRVDLVFEINEGPTTGIRRINFIGNKKFSDSTLRDAIATRETRWWRFLSSSDNYDPDRLAYDRELVRRYYLTRGYADFRVVSAVAELSPDREDFFITFSLDEGEPYTFSSSTVESKIADLHPEGLSEIVRTQPGDVYNAEKIEKTIDDLTFEAGRLGYAFVDIRPKIVHHREQRTISVSYQINEAPRVYVDRINITGNVRTLDKVIRREFRLVEGDAYNSAKLSRSKDRLKSLSFFDKVEINEVPGSAPDRTNINVEVTEKSTGELQLGAGYSTTESVVGDISIRERNLLGRGQDLRLGLSLSSKRSQIDLSFTEPYFMDRNIAAGFDIFNIRRNLQSESSYDQKVLGFALRGGFPLSEYTRFVGRYTLRKDTIDNIGYYASRAVIESAGTEITSSVGYNTTYDTRDDAKIPTKGINFTFGNDIAGLGGTVRYLRTSASATIYYEVAEGFVASAGFDGGHIVGLGEDIRLNDRFYIGGTDFRGFKRGGLGPRELQSEDALGGNMYGVGTLEMTFPNGLPEQFGVRTSFFNDVGTLTGIDKKDSGIVDSGSIRAAGGVAVSWDSPFGPIGVALAQAYKKESYDKTEIFRFNFGTRF